MRQAPLPFERIVGRSVGLNRPDRIIQLGQGLGWPLGSAKRIEELRLGAHLPGHKMTPLITWLPPR
jgi:hypothetical protein